MSGVPQLMVGAQSLRLHLISYHFHTIFWMEASAGTEFELASASVSIEL
jgi:hypothetical protein